MCLQYDDFPGAFKPESEQNDAYKTSTISETRIILWKNFLFHY